MSNLSQIENPIVFFDVSMDKNKLGRLKFSLFANLVPKAAQIFRQFCTGQFHHYDKPIGYKDTFFHKIVQNVLVEGGDFTGHDGKNAKKVSIYGQETTFEDECLSMKHDKAGILTMVNTGVNTNSNIFQMTASPCPWLDGKQVICGEAINDSTIKIIKDICNLESNSDGKPKNLITINQCGQM